MANVARAFVRRIWPLFGRVGRVDGSVTLVTAAINGTFADSTGWGLGTSCTVNAGNLWCNNNAGNSTNTYTISLPAGLYRVTYDVVSQNQGNVIFRFNTTGGQIAAQTLFNPITPGTYVEEISIPNAITSVEFRVTRSNNAMDIRLDNLVLQQVIQE